METQMDINGHDTKIKIKEMIEFTAKSKSDANPFGVSGKLIKVEKPFIVLIKVDPWNSELHQFETSEEAGEFIVRLA
jgi:hypothetical protein